jgi:mutator protein MutT
MPLETVPVVAGILVRDDQFFIAKRNPGGPAGEKWEFPGGKVESGELPQKALERELLEELGICVIVGQSLGLYRTIVGTKVIELDCYWARWKAGDIKLTSHSEYRWVPAGELSNFDLAEPDTPVVQEIQAQASATFGPMPPPDKMPYAIQQATAV